MHAHTRELLAYLTRTRQDLEDAAYAVPADRRTAPPPRGGWSAAQTIEHVAIVETRLTAMLMPHVDEAIRAGAPARDDRSVVDETLAARATDRTRRIDASEQSQPTGASWDESWAALERSREALRALVTRADGLDLGATQVPHRAFGPLTLYQWITFVGAHEMRHAAQIRAGLD